MDDIIGWDRFVALTVVDSRRQTAARCLVCGGQVAAGEGITALFEGRTLRFRCQGCLGRFAEDPDRFLAGRVEPWCLDAPHGSTGRN
jgi:hypothetical protein